MQAYLVTQAFRPRPSQRRVAANHSRAQHTWTHIDLDHIKLLAGFGDTSGLSLWLLEQQIRLRRVLMRLGLMKPMDMQIIEFELRPADLAPSDQPPFVARTAVAPSWLQWAAKDKERLEDRAVAIGELLCEMFAREPHLFVPKPADFVGNDTAWERHFRAYVRDPTCFYLSASTSVDAVDPITGAIRVWVPEVRAGSLRIAPEPVPNLLDVAGNPWLAVLEERCRRDMELKPAKFAKIRAQAAYQNVETWINDPRGAARELAQLGIELELYEGHQRRNSHNRKARQRVLRTRRWRQQHLDSHTFRSWSGMTLKRGHGTAEVLPLLETAWSTWRATDPLVPLCGYASGHVLVHARDTADTRWLRHRVVHLEFRVRLRLDVDTVDRLSAPDDGNDPILGMEDDNGDIESAKEIWVEGGLPVHPAYVNQMYTRKSNPKTFEERLTDWLHPGFLFCLFC